MPWKKTDSDADASLDQAAVENIDAAEALPKGYTPKKGKPTPKRSEAERASGIRRGPVTPPLTSKEARQRKKDMRNSMSKDEYKAKKMAERNQRREQRRYADERMAAGDPKYLLPRDQGEERALVRDYIDSRRFVANIFLPFAILMLVVLVIGSSFPAVSNIMTLVAMVVIIFLFFEGLIIGRNANKIVRERFPNTHEKKIAIGFYAYSRASQPRRMRTPRARVNIGDQVL